MEGSVAGGRFRAKIRKSPAKSKNDRGPLGRPWGPFLTKKTNKNHDFGPWGPWGPPWGPHGPPLRCGTCAKRIVLLFKLAS